MINEMKRDIALTRLTYLEGGLFDWLSPHVEATWYWVGGIRNYEELVQYFQKSFIYSSLKYHLLAVLWDKVSFFEPEEIHLDPSSW